MTFMVIAAAAVAAGTALVEDRTAGERVRVAAWVLFTCAAAVAGGGWVMRLIHG